MKVKFSVLLLELGIITHSPKPIYIEHIFNTKMIEFLLFSFVIWQQFMWDPRKIEWEMMVVISSRYVEKTKGIESMCQLKSFILD